MCDRSVNFIERCWSWLKSPIRKQLDQYECLRDAIDVKNAGKVTTLVCLLLPRPQPHQ